MLCKPWFPRAISNEIGHRSISIGSERRCLYTRFYLTLGNRGFPFWAQVSPSKWLMAGSILPQLPWSFINKSLVLDASCADTSRLHRCRSHHAAHPARPALVLLTSWWLWEQESVLASCDTRLGSVFLLSGLSSEMLLQAGVRAAE